MFPKENILVITFDEYSNLLLEVWRKLATFLNIQDQQPKIIEKGAENVSLQRRRLQDFPEGALVKKVMGRLPPFAAPFTKSATKALRCSCASRWIAGFV